MVRLRLILFIAFFNLLADFVQPSFSMASTSVDDSCPVNVDFNREEIVALRLFLNRLSSLQKHFGRTTFQENLVSVLMQNFPDKKVVEVSAAFYERVLHLVDQQYLANDIAMTVGTHHRLWWNEFRPQMQNVTHYRRPIRGFELKRFRQSTEDLINTVISLTPDQMEKRGLRSSEADIIKARTVMGLQEVHAFIENWHLINLQLQRMRTANTTVNISLLALGLFPAGVIATTTVKANAIIAAASRFAVSFSSDAVVARRLSRLSQVLASGSMGAAGGTAAVMLSDISTVLTTSGRNSRNNDSLYMCELNKQLIALKQRGAAPYLSGMAIGGTIGAGLVGGSLFLSKTGNRALLTTTVLGVGGVTMYSMNQIRKDTMIAIAELEYAKAAMESGDRPLAMFHKQKARQHQGDAKVMSVNFVLLSILSWQLRLDTPHAYRQGEELIRSIFASSADTLPTALQTAIVAINGE